MYANHVTVNPPKTPLSLSTRATFAHFECSHAMPLPPGVDYFDATQCPSASQACQESAVDTGLILPGHLIPPANATPLGHLAPRAVAAMSPGP